MYNHILITSDGSDFSNKGVQHGLQLARVLNCKVTVLTVTEPFFLHAGVGGSGWIATEEDISRFTATQNEFADDILKQASTAAAKLGVTISPLRVENQFPAEAITDEAARLGCDLIVMASHGRRGLSRLLLGSQTAEVLTRSKIPVLVVR